MLQELPGFGVPAQAGQGMGLQSLLDGGIPFC